MKTAIFTVIKNEHRYLEDWIKYHLQLGINHLFIFEDSDSESHNEITSRYPQVTLKKIMDVVDPKTAEATAENKSKGIYVQSRYILDGLLYIASLKVYDWCFALDCDEYITFENDNDDLISILSQFQDYDAVLLQWKNYGANGLVYMPDYKEKGIVDTYTKPCKNNSDNASDMTKVCYNMRTYTKRHFLTNHQPSDKCRWCNTNFEEKRGGMRYDRMYLRHYITKSWQEYLNKLYTRGMFCKWHRDFRDFFILNPEMEKDREKLENEILAELFPNAEEIKKLQKS